MGFTLKGHLLGADSPLMTHRVIANSQTIQVGDAVKLTSGYVTVSAADERIFGIVAGIVDQNGIDLNSTASSNYDGTWDDVNQIYVATSDNSTDKKVKAVIIADPFALFANVASQAMTLAMLGLHFSLTNETQVNGSTSSATVGEMYLWDLPDPDDLTKGVFRISAWQGDAWEPET